MAALRYGGPEPRQLILNVQRFTRESVRHANSKPKRSPDSSHVTNSSFDEFTASTRQFH